MGLQNSENESPKKQSLLLKDHLNNSSHHKKQLSKQLSHVNAFTDAKDMLEDPLGSRINFLENEDEEQNLRTHEETKGELELFLE